VRRDNVFLFTQCEIRHAIPEPSDLFPINSSLHYLFRFPFCVRSDRLDFDLFFSCSFFRDLRKGKGTGEKLVVVKVNFFPIVLSSLSVPETESGVSTPQSM